MPCVSQAVSATYTPTAKAKPSTKASRAIRLVRMSRLDPVEIRHARVRISRASFRRTAQLRGAQTGVTRGVQFGRDIGKEQNPIRLVADRGNDPRIGTRV